ncbi:death-on-curing protein [Kineococcus radiotolerans]|uniref:Death-on-curing protein n=1 Tax=Kineococcus radiotolerans TaxID=131568 RepID=A0A7W4XZ43_KINRA|nr:Fic family protein [Kineococcus radiotolerans]MBB2903182.1 death-on-curing protein [Kineococcus radiotolerans]
MTQAEPPLDHLTTEDLLEIAAGVVQDVQVRDLGLLASAAARPRTTVFGREAYPTLADKAAALMHSLARNNPLVDGNKRLAWSATRVLCLLNRTDLVMDVDEAERTVLAMAAGDLDAGDLARVIRRHLG